MVFIGLRPVPVWRDATMNAITVALYDDGAAADVFALTITRTRSSR